MNGAFPTVYVNQLHAASDSIKIYTIYSRNLILCNALQVVRPSSRLLVILSKLVNGITRKIPAEFENFKFLIGIKTNKAKN